MERNRKQSDCADCGNGSDCGNGYSRRDFLAGAAGAAIAAGTLGPSTLAAADAAKAVGPTRNSAAENAVRMLYDTLTDDQKKVMALPLTDERRLTIDANWSITNARIGSFDAKQQEIIHQIIKGVTSEDGYERFIKQMADDWSSVNRYTVAIFGNPHEKEFEFELTGRHLTMRADGNTKQGVALGGPIVYGHAKPGNSAKNLFFYQTQQANEVFKMLDGKQRQQALLEKAPREGAVGLRKAGRRLPGIGAGDLSSDQQEQLKKSLMAVLQPYRQQDVAEVMQMIEDAGGLEKLHISFYMQGDLGKDEVWDIWRIEGPSIVCHFRGAPHVHAYINVARQS